MKRMIKKEITRASLMLSFEEIREELKSIESFEKLATIENYIIRLQDIIEYEIMNKPVKKRRNRW